ncbi:tyrosine-type recombinase/integrase [Nocardia sp. NPDC057353]|uniref:tyrosine-type recombinase/integrase n=1 Tax=Nocardia sp. NPDC057353 TaxID=3346104 RepID=UPI00362EB19D
MSDDIRVPAVVAAGPLLAGFTAEFPAQRAPVARFLAWLAARRGFEDALDSAAGRDLAVRRYLRVGAGDGDLTALRLFYRWLGLGAPEAGLVPDDERALTTEQERAVLGAAARRGSRAYALLLLALDTGAGGAELAALDLGALDLAEWPGLVTIGPGRTVPIAGATRGAVTAWLAERRLLACGDVLATFVTEQAPHRRLAHRTVAEILRAIGAEAGAELGGGVLRCTAGQRLARAGLPPDVVARRLGRRPGDRVPLPPRGREQLDLFACESGEAPSVPRSTDEAMAPARRAP